MNLSKEEIKLVQALVRQQIILSNATLDDRNIPDEHRRQQHEIRLQLKNLDSRLDRVARGKLAQERKAAR